MNWVKKTGSYLLEGILDTDSENGKFRVVETKNPAGYAGSWEQEFSIDKEGMQTIHPVTYTHLTLPTKLEV